MEANPSKITLHMVASLDGFIGKKDGMVELWYEVQTE